MPRPSLRADAGGTLAVDTAIATEGTYVGADPLGLLWSGTALPLAGDPARPVTQHVLLADSADLLVRVDTASAHGAPWLETRLRLTDGSSSLSVEDVDTPGLVGVFARPKATPGKPLPAILLLHGSEGGTRASARETAARFARLGYAAFAVIYFAWPGTGVDGVPHALLNIPVETLGQCAHMAHASTRGRRRHRLGVGCLQGRRVGPRRRGRVPVDQPCRRLRPQQRRLDRLRTGFIAP